MGPGFFAWVIPGSAIVLATGIFFLKFLVELPRMTRKQFIVAGCLFMGGALEVEFIETYYWGRHGGDNFAWQMIGTTQECLEMVGIVVFIWALLKYCEQNYRELRLRLA